MTVSAINVEITCRTCGSISIRATCTLTEKYRQGPMQETKNKEAQDKDGYDPGGVISRLQNQFIQPLVLRGNQGRLREDDPPQPAGGDGSQQKSFRGSGMIIVGCSRVTTINPDSMRRQGQSGGDGMVLSRRRSGRAAASSIPTAMIAS